MDYQFLNKISSPADIKKLNKAETSALCDELRDCIINTVSKNGGHLASNLGAVELTVALHKTFSSPKDAIIFDVGHQCYSHKLLTGRFEHFHTLRTEGGISGFMRPEESEHDPIITGHSSNSISAAYGIYRAKRLLGKDGTAIAVIGDGALTGGMAYEALNNVGSGRNNLIVVLNDNKMSISRNVGALARSLTKMRNKPRYHRFKDVFSSVLLKIPFIGERLHKWFFSMKEAIKTVVYKDNIFCTLGFNYLGPVDGHNVEAMSSLFEVAKSSTRPSVVHVITTKGKGYSYAELSPKNYHGVSAFDVDEGACIEEKPCFSKIAGDTLVELAENDNNICAITAAMKNGTGLSSFAEKYKSRFFDVGIAEQHAVTFAAGLAKEGMKPFFAVYSSFLQRGYDQIIHDVAISKLPVRFLIDRAGIVGEDGETHQGMFDVSYLTSIPNISVYSPANYKELKYRIEMASKHEEFCAIRYPRGVEENCLDFDPKEDFSVIKGNGKQAVVTYGRLFSEASKAYNSCQFIDIIKLNKIYPLNNDLINLLCGYEKITVFEETVKSGGIGEHISALLLENNYKGSFNIKAISNEFLPTVKTTDAINKYCLNSDAMLSGE